MTLTINTSESISYIVTNPLLDPVFVNDATVTVTITDCLGTDLVGESWPVALPYVALSDGLYRKSFDPFVNLIEGDLYTVIINVVGADLLESECVSKVEAKRKFC